MYSSLTPTKNASTANTTDDQLKIFKSALITKRLTNDLKYISEVTADDFRIKNGKPN